MDSSSAGLPAAHEPGIAEQVSGVDIAGLCRAGPENHHDHVIVAAPAAGHQALAGGPGRSRLDAVIPLGIQKAIGVGPDSVPAMTVWAQQRTAAFQRRNVLGEGGQGECMVRELREIPGIDRCPGAGNPLGLMKWVSHRPKRPATRFISAMNRGKGSALVDASAAGFRRPPKCSASATAASLPEGKRRP